MSQIISQFITQKYITLVKKNQASADGGTEQHYKWGPRAYVEVSIHFIHIHIHIIHFIQYKIIGPVRENRDVFFCRDEKLSKSKIRRNLIWRIFHRGKKNCVEILLYWCNDQY